MKAATLFSGIGAPEVAMPEWEWIWHAEIEPFPSAVFSARHPQSVNLGDVTAHDFIERAEAIGRPDVIVFGSPCQAFSVAGRRVGMDDPRGNLALIALGIVARLRPRWFVFENVPGLLSSYSGSDEAARVVAEGAVGAEAESDEDCDFAAFLAAADGIGASVAWSVLDAQYFGVAQRRERVFVVGSFGDWRGPAAVLLEPESLCGDSPTRREAGQDVAGTVAARTTGGGGFSTDFEAAGGLVPTRARALTTSNQRIDAGSGTLIPSCFAIQAGALRENADSGPDGVGIQSDLAYTLEARAEVQATAHSLRGEGFDASEDGTGRGVPLVPAVAKTLTSGGTGERGRLDPVNTDLVVHHFQGRGSNIDLGQDVAGTLSQNCDRGSGGAPCVAFNWNASPSQGMRVADADADAVDSLRASHCSEPAVTVALRGREGGGTAEMGDEVATAIRASQGGGDKPHVLTRMAVRRLTPRECERLQGFPDDFTAIEYRRKPAADGPRYKAIGNSMAIPVLRWILSRIEQVDRLIGPIAK